MRTQACVLLLILLTGCERTPPSRPAPTWAVIETATIQSAVSDSIKEKHPYPQEINDENYRALQQENRRLNQQASSLRTAAIQRCMAQDKSDAPQAEQKTTQGVSSTNIMQINVHGLARGGACIQKIDDDQLIADLKAKIESFSKIEQQRSRHDNMVRKTIQSTIQAATEAYARAHGLALVIDSRSDIAYNQSNQLLDVTQGVVEQILNPPPAQ